MSALKFPMRPGPLPTEEESQIALESSRRLGPVIADLAGPDDGHAGSKTARLVVRTRDSSTP